MRSRRVESGGAVLALREWGDREHPTILFAHGYPDSGAVWDALVERLAADFHVAVFDMRGMGESSAPPGREAFAIERLAEDIAAVAGAVGGRVHLVGHDWGGMAAWDGILRGGLAEQLASYTAIAAPSLDHTGDAFRRTLRRPTPAGLAGIGGQAARSWYMAAFNLPKLPELAFRALGRRGGDEETGLALYRQNMPLRLGASVRPLDGLPVQLIIPTRDPFISPRTYEGIERGVSDIRVRRVRAGHWVQKSHPDQVARELRRFVGAVEARRAA